MNKIPENTFFNKDISDHLNYGGSYNWDGRLFATNLIGKAKTILDVGCGNGLFYKACKEKELSFEKYKGVDYAYNFIIACKSLYKEAEWEVQDANDLQEADKSYDLVVLYHLLENTNGYKKVINEALRIAKNRVLIVFWKGLYVDSDDDIKELEGNYELSYSSRYSAHKFIEHLKGLGFSNYFFNELYADEYRYNLYFILDKRFMRIETGITDEKILE